MTYIKKSKNQVIVGVDTEKIHTQKALQELIKDFENGEYDVLCNSMLLTEGWDCPAVDCVIVLRPTRVRSLYQQMIISI